jgi:hypothetical protein
MAWQKLFHPAWFFVPWTAPQVGNQRKNTIAKISWQFHPNLLDRMDQTWHNTQAIAPPTITTTP